MQITPNLIEKIFNPHKVEYIKNNGYWNKLLGKRIKGEDVKTEVNEKLEKIMKEWEW